MIVQLLYGAAVALLTASALLALIRLARGPSSLDRAVASDVLLVTLAMGVAAHALWLRTHVGLILILVLSLLGFTAAVGLARLITGATAQERRFRAAEASAAADEEAGR